MNGVEFRASSFIQTLTRLPSVMASSGIDNFTIVLRSRT
jgi:hypothetical protein